MIILNHRVIFCISSHTTESVPAIDLFLKFRSSIKYSECIKSKI